MADKATKVDIRHPDYYTTGGIETFDFIEAKELNFNLGNVVKYISRCGKKRSTGMSDEQKALQDLNKAKVYLEREITLREMKMLKEMNAREEMKNEIGINRSGN